MKTAILAPLALLVTMTVVGCGGKTAANADGSKTVVIKADTPVSVDNQQQMQQKEAPKNAAVLKLGDTATFNNALAVKLNSIRLHKPGADSLDKPANGAYIVFDVTITNNNKEKPFPLMGTLPFSIYDREGVRHDAALFAGTKGNLSGEIAPGAFVRGEVAFDFPSDKGFKFSYSLPFKMGYAEFSIEPSDMAK